MSEPGKIDQAGSLRRRRAFEALAWLLLIAFLWTADTFAKISYRNNTGIGKDNFRLITEQVTSASAVLVMIVFVSYWLRLFPLRKSQWTAAVIGHTVGSIIFAFGHHVLIIVQRVVFYAASDMPYMWKPNFVANLIVEYQKDIKIYVGVVAIMSAYQYYRATQGIPRVAVGASGSVESASPQRADVSNRLVVQTAKGEAFIRYDEIDYAEASRNYVEVHAGQRSYLIRDTISSVEARLASGPFMRIHRSFVVNIDMVAEVKLVDGSQQVFLKSGTSLPLSRGYRDAFKSAIAPM